MNQTPAGPNPEDEEFVLEDAARELDESEVDDPTAIGDSRFREAGEAAALGDIYQRVTQLLDSEQDLLRFESGISVLDGLRDLSRHSYSQAPVMRADRCIGVFSYRSFARTMAALPELKSGLAQITVEDCLEQIPYVRLDDNVDDIFDALDRHDAVLVGEPARVLAMVSPMDALYYLYGVANGYTLIRQIELALRHVIRISTTAETFAECIGASVAQKYERQGRNSPERLEELEFSDITSIITTGRTWQHFKGVLGENQDLVKSRLAPIAEIRNALFHFRRPISAEEYDTLALTRNWLLLRVEFAETPQREGLA